MNRSPDVKPLVTKSRPAALLRRNSFPNHSVATWLQTHEGAPAGKVGRSRALPNDDPAKRHLRHALVALKSLLRNLDPRYGTMRLDVERVNPRFYRINPSGEGSYYCLHGKCLHSEPVLFTLTPEGLYQRCCDVTCTRADPPPIGIDPSLFRALFDADVAFSEVSPSPYARPQGLSPRLVFTDTAPAPDDRIVAPARPATPDKNRGRTPELLRQQGTPRSPQRRRTLKKPRLTSEADAAQPDDA